MTDSRETMAERLRTALELFEDGVQMYRLKVLRDLEREHPDATREEREAIADERLRRWLEHRPGAEHGDGWGEPCPWPHSSHRS